MYKTPSDILSNWVMQMRIEFNSLDGFIDFTSKTLGQLWTNREIVISSII